MAFCTTTFWAPTGGGELFVKGTLPATVTVDGWFCGAGGHWRAAGTLR